MIDRITTQNYSQKTSRIIDKKFTPELDDASQPLLESNELSLSPISVASPSASRMSHNYTHTDDNKSKYMQARERGNAAVSQQLNRQNATLAIAIAEINALPEEQQNNYAMRSYIGRKAARRMLQEKEVSTHEASERNLKEIKEAIENNVEESKSINANRQEEDAFTVEENEIMSEMPEATNYESPPFTETSAVRMDQTEKIPLSTAPPAASESTNMPSVDVIV